MTNNGGAETLNDALCDIARTTGGGVDFETIPGEGGDVECPYCGEVTMPDNNLNEAQQKHVDYFAGKLPPNKSGTGDHYD